MQTFKLLMVSAGFEHGGNVIHRHLDGHTKLNVYPFESQLGNQSFFDFLASIERVQYRYPEFAEGLSAFQLYEQMIDEELKTFLRKRVASKFRDVPLDMDEGDRIRLFEGMLGCGPYLRRNVIEMFFRATFAAWKNHCNGDNRDNVYVGYSPAIGIDSERLVRDFPNVRIMHIIRNPFSAYRDTKRRPFPQSLTRYLITWNIYHSTVELFSRMYPQNVRIFRYEDLVADKEQFMRNVSTFAGVEFQPTMLYPSWNGTEIKDEIAPWGTVLRSTEDYNASVIIDLSADEKRAIAGATTAIARHFRYHEVPYLRGLYGAD